MMKKRIAIVTGVSRLKGIGKAICCALAEEGIDIFFTYWQPYDKQMPWKVAEDEPDLIEEEIKKNGVRCEKLAVDLSKKSAVERLLKAVKTKLGSPSILINNATYSTQTSIETLTAKELDKHYDINLKATTLLTVEFIRQFNAEDGRIINLTSGQSLSNMSNEIAYAITKSAIETLTRTISSVAATKGITINAVNPGLTDTGWLNEAENKNWAKYFPAGRIGKPTDVAKLVAFLANEKAAWVTGQVIHSEGGFNRENYDV